LSVIVAAGPATTSRPSSQPGQAIVATIDGVRLRSTVAASGLDEPTSLAFAADGRVFIAERAGRIRVVHDSRSLPTTAVTLDDVIATDRNGLLAIALDPDFDRTRFVYAIYTAASGFRLARLRAVDDLLIDRVILMDAVAPPARRPAAALRFGPDAKLYVAVDDGDVPDAAGDLGSYSGKVLRLNAEGTTPADQAGGTPVFALSLNRPRGLDWDASGALWIAETERLQAVVAETQRQRRGTAVARYLLPDGSGASALGFYRADLIPRFRGDLLIAADDHRTILRLKLDPAQPTKVVSTERLPLDPFDSVRALGVGRDGAIYFCTSDALIKLEPEPAVDGR
jgi:glucose/arabinose dehydrogenase